MLRRMFNVARKQWKWKIANPVSDIELPEARNERVRYLAEDEHGRLAAALKTAGEKWLGPFVILALDTGLRLSNLCDLTWQEVDVFGRKIVIEAEKMKNGDYHGIPLTERACETLNALHRVRCLSNHVFHEDGKKLYDRKVQRAFRRALKQSGIENHFHDLRHTFASYLRQRGGDLHTISKLLGHKDTRMTQRYAHLSIESLRSAVAVLEGESGYILATVGGEKGAVCAVTP